MEKKSKKLPIIIALLAVILIAVVVLVILFSDKDDEIVNDKTETEEIKNEANFIEYKEVNLFEARFLNRSDTSGIIVKELVGWTMDTKANDSVTPDELTKDNIRIRYWAMTEAEVNEQIKMAGESGFVASLEYLNNDDGDTIICMKYDFNGTSGDIEISYDYYKKVSDDLYLSILVYDKNGGEAVGDSGLETYLPITNDCYYIYELGE